MKDPNTPSFAQRFDAFFDRHRQAFFMLIMALAALMSIVMFDAKVSLSGDDCDYILAADDFWHHFVFPSHHGSLYPIVLSPFVGLFGYKLVLLKFLSVIFTVGSFWFFYKAFERRIPSAVLIPAMLLAAVCSYIFFYAGYTYSEPLFMLLQSVYLYFFSRYFWVKDGIPNYTLRNDWKKYLTLGALTLAMGMTREIGFCVIGVLILYFAVKGRWKDLLYTVGAALLMLAAFYLIKGILWTNASAGHSFTNLMAKDYYNPNAGMEDASGLMVRFWDNSRIYLSAFLCQMLGIVPETPSNRFDADAGRTVVIYMVYFAALVVIMVRRNTPLLFAGLYAGVLNFASFIVLQTIWAQDRLIMIYYPLILVFLLGALYYAFSTERLRRFFLVYPVVLLILLGGTLNTTRNRVGRTLPVLQQNLLLGDPLYGFTPDWQNFIKASQWVATNTEKDAVIVSRKPSMSKVYTERDFAGLPASLTVPADTLNYLKGDTGIVAVVADAAKGVMSGEVLRYIITPISEFMIGDKPSPAACVYTFPRNDVEKALQDMQQAGIAYTLDLDQTIAQCQTTDVRIYDPDMMLRLLKEQHVTYLLLAQLRIDPTRNTGQYINNIHRYAWFISTKYPDSFEIIKTFGTSEPCEILRLIR